MTDDSLSKLSVNRSDAEAAEMARVNFARYERLLWFWDNKLRFWLRNAFDVQYEPGAFVGFLYERYVACWKHYDPSISAFTTYFYKARLRQRLFRDFLRWESDLWGKYVHNIQATPDETAEQNANFAFHEQGNTLYHVPDLDGEWLDDLFERFGGTRETWEFVYATLSDRERFIVSRRIAGQTLESLGRDIKLTKERVRQIEALSLEKIKVRCRAHPAVKDLFGQG